ncbi:ArsR/SmtB family transcription factor [Lichenicola sp.]|uniref:ArsR/SmtB family transcription factor n=1 Tax=Lichenicola sp. TaxID=2804529 RepID=UPI003B00E2C0
MTLVMRALGDPRRYDIMMQLAAADAPVPCYALDQTAQVSASTMSHHLQQLEQAGLIDVSRDGRFTVLRFVRARYEDFLRQLADSAAPASPAVAEADAI